MPEQSPYPNESKEDYKKRIKKLKAKTSKMRLAVVKDLTSEYEGEGKVAPSRVSDGFDTPLVYQDPTTIIKSKSGLPLRQPGKKHAVPNHQDYDFKSDFQHKLEKRLGLGEKQEWGIDQMNKKGGAFDADLDDIGDQASISINNAEKYAAFKKKSKSN